MNDVVLRHKLYTLRLFFSIILHDCTDYTTYSASRFKCFFARDDIINSHPNIIYVLCLYFTQKSIKFSPNFWTISSLFLKSINSNQMVCLLIRLSFHWENEGIFFLKILPPEKWFTSKFDKKSGVQQLWTKITIKLAYTHFFLHFFLHFRDANHDDEW